MSNVSYLTVTPDCGAGQRIDNYLVKKLKTVPKAKIYSILRKGEVRVNKGRIKPSYKLQANDVVRVPPLTIGEPRSITSKQVASINLEVLYEDRGLLIVNKPAGLAVHGGSGLNFGLIELLRAQRPLEQSLELVHRLDRDTSGCIMIAKKPATLRALHELLRNNSITKTYHALVIGNPTKTFSVSEPLLKYVLTSGERLVKVHPEGKASHTNFKVLQRLETATLLEARPITGRTHQIRVHAACQGFPIIGDDKYGDKQKARRLYLHARNLSFTCPLTNQTIAVQADYDSHWQEGILQYGRRQ